MIHTSYFDYRYVRHCFVDLWELSLSSTVKPVCSLLFIGWLLIGGPNEATAQPFDPAPPTLRVMSWNVEWMFDDDPTDNRSKLSKEQSAPSKKYWMWKLDAVTAGIAEKQPEIVALQEIEGKQTLAEICSRLRSEHQLSYRYAFIEGSDSFTEQDVGLLMRGGLASYRRHEQSKTMFDSQDFYNLSKHLVGEFKWSNVDSPLSLMVLHLRATEAAEDLRVRQARLARHWLEPALAANEDVLLLGDLNSEHPAGRLEGDIAAIVGSGDQPKMVDLLSKLPDVQAATHLVLDKQFDRILASPSLMVDGPGLDWCFEKIEILPELVIRGQRDGEEHWHDRLTMPLEELDISDHFPVMATFRLQ
jgi:endonuclease/exonuclease/phosphatase family metal-dependent hydrolase